MSSSDHTAGMTPPAAPAMQRPAAAPETPAAPRTRWASIIWGLVFAAIAVSGIWTLSVDSRREELMAWIGELTPGTLGGIALLTVGALVLVLGAIGLIRRVQRRSAS